jgi:hypothetical protein
MRSVEASAETLRNTTLLTLALAEIMASVAANAAGAPMFSTIVLFFERTGANQQLRRLFDHSSHKAKCLTITLSS